MDIETLVIAHRGASGYLPEHTREAKVLAYGQRADYLEQDVVATRDGHLVVLHDIHLDEVTDVAVRYPERARADGRHYVIDFDLVELQDLRIVERRRSGSSHPQRSARFADDRVAFRVVTLEDELRLIGALNRTSGRDVGIYPEIKHPEWHHRHGFDLADALLKVLGQHGYCGPEHAAFVQCFDADELRRCREELGTRLKLVRLVHATEVTTAELLDRTAEFADVLAPHYLQLLASSGETPSGAAAPSGSTSYQPAPLVELARDRGLGLHTYTLRLDDPAGRPGFEALLEALYAQIRVDGLFCDHPDAAVRVRDRLQRI